MNETGTGVRRRDAAADPRRENRNVRSEIATNTQRPRKSRCQATLSGAVVSSRGRTRTYDPLINSQML
jgi:hypothetical protein